MSSSRHGSGLPTGARLPSGTQSPPATHITAKPYKDRKLQPNVSAPRGVPGKPEGVGGSALKGEATAYEVAREVKWDVGHGSWDGFPSIEKYFAMGEALAHLKYLEAMGVLVKLSLGDVGCYTLSGRPPHL